MSEMQPDAGTPDFAAGVAVAQSAQAAEEAGKATQEAEIATVVSSDAASMAAEAQETAAVATETAAIAAEETAFTRQYVDERFQQQDQKLSAIQDALTVPSAAEPSGPPPPDSKTETAAKDKTEGKAPETVSKRASMEDRHTKAFWG
jgi:hypothetical protein